MVGMGNSTHTTLTAVARLALMAAIAMLATAAYAQGIKVSAPGRVQTGENFKVAYRVGTQDVSGFRTGQFPDGLEVVAGPYTSSQSSYQMVNGHTSSSSSVTYTFTVYAAKGGTYTIPAAQAVVAGKKSTSPTRKVTVAGNAPANHGGQPRMHGDYDEEAPLPSSAGKPISGSDLFIKVSASKRSVYEQEPVLLTYKVYSLVNLTQLEGKMPDLTGFHTQEVPLPKQKSFHVERVNGKPYRCVTWSQYVMFPQVTGKLSIPGITFKGIVMVQNRTVDPLEAFLNGGSGYVELKKDIQAPGVELQVAPLPARPEGFSGGVGRFSISASVDKKTVKTGEPVTVRVVVSGTGNLKLLKQPSVSFPKDFDKYDPKVKDKVKVTPAGLEGSMVYEFLAVPRNKGGYDIPAVKLVYFDIASKSYKTATTAQLHIDVEQGEGASGGRADFMAGEDSDIRPIAKGGASVCDPSAPFYGSTGYWLWIAIPFLVFAAIVVSFRKRAKDNADAAKARGRKANKVATVRLREANQLMLKGLRAEFYEEVLHALWGYAGDKLGIPAEKLSRDNIAEALVAAGAGEEATGMFIDAIDECEYARYAPGEDGGNMGNTFDKAMHAIMKTEAAMKPAKGGAAAAKALLAVALLMPAVAFSATKADGDSAYVKGDYQQAIKDYTEVLSREVSPEVYYNLGNAYFKSGETARAVLSYERAKLLDPGNGDIRHNAAVAKSRTIDKVADRSSMFFVAWYGRLADSLTSDGWAWVSIAAAAAAMALLLLYFFSGNVPLRKAGFFGAAFSIALFILANILAARHKEALQNRTGAVVMSTSAVVKKSPSADGADGFNLHEGTVVEITDKSVKGWYGISLPDGRSGWIDPKAVEVV